MDPKKKAFLEAQGISVGSAAEFLGLTPAQEMVTEVKVRLSYALRRARKVSGLTQAALAEQMGVPQQTVARLETIHKSITIDMLMRALITAGVSLDQIAQEMAHGAAQLAQDRGEIAPKIEASAPPVLQLVPMKSTPVAPESLPMPNRRRSRQGALQIELQNGRQYNFSGGVKRGFDDTLCNVAEQTRKAEAEAREESHVA